MIKKISYIVYKILWFIDFLLHKLIKRKLLVWFSEFIEEDAYRQIKIQNSKIKLFTPHWATNHLADNFFTKEPETIEWIDKFDNANKNIFWDIGANVGLFSIYAAVKHTNLNIVSFEPSTSNLRILSRNISINNLEERIKINQFPLSNVKNKYLLFKEDKFMEGVAMHTWGENYNFEGSILTTDTLICIAYPLPNGCDSTVCLTLDVLENITFLADSFCQGSSYQFNNQELTTGGIYADTLLSFNGCDSIILLDLMETLPVITNMNDSFCEGDSFEWDGMIITQPGLYFDTIVGVNGCDSLLSLSLSMDLMPSVSLETTGSFCEQETVEISVQPFVSYLWSTGETNASIDVNEPGDYSVEVIDMQGCQGTANITVEEGSMVDFLYAVQEPTCFNGFDGQILIDTAFGGTPPYLYSINGQALQSANIFTNLAGGTYAILVEDVDGCRNETEIIVNQPAEIFVTLDDDQTIRLGETIELNALTNTFNSTVFWSPSDFLSCDTCLQTTAAPQQSMTYQVSISDANGCTVTDEISIFVNQQTGAYVPNVFSPNNDGINDYFFVYVDGSIASISTFRIFDRWGGVLFETSGIFPNDETAGWNGLANNELLDSGIYIYFIEVLRVDGARETLKGDVLLVR